MKKKISITGNPEEDILFHELKKRNAMNEDYLLSLVEKIKDATKVIERAGELAQKTINDYNSNYGVVFPPLETPLKLAIAEKIIKLEKDCNKNPDEIIMGDIIIYQNKAYIVRSVTVGGTRTVFGELINHPEEEKLTPINIDEIVAIFKSVKK